MASKTLTKLAPVSLPIQLGLVARVRQRLFPISAKMSTPPCPRSPPSISFTASIAEFLLVVRLKARSQRKVQAAEILERASHIVFVTCKDWFSTGDGKASGGRKPL